jgi:hypothetical protein
MMRGRASRDLHKVVKGSRTKATRTTLTLPTFYVILPCRKHNIRGEELLELDTDFLKHMGIENVGHIMRFLKHIGNLKVSFHRHQRGFTIHTTYVRKP